MKQSQEESKAAYGGLLWWIPDTTSVGQVVFFILWTFWLHKSRRLLFQLCVWPESQWPKISTLMLMTYNCSLSALWPVAWPPSHFHNLTCPLGLGFYAASVSVHEPILTPFFCTDYILALLLFFFLDVSISEFSKYLLKTWWDLWSFFSTFFFQNQVDNLSPNLNTKLHILS